MQICFSINSENSVNIVFNNLESDKENRNIKEPLFLLTSPPTTLPQFKITTIK